MNLVLALIVSILATFRVSHLVVREDGPFSMFRRLRAGLRRRGWHGPLDCLYCTSVWVALPFAYYAYRNLSGGGSMVDALPLWLAISGGACLLDRLGQSPIVMEPLNESQKDEE